MTMVLGVDPGAVSAAWALLDTDDQGFAKCGDVPVVDRMVDIQNFIAVVRDSAGDLKLAPGEHWVGVIEKVNAFPGQGIASAFRFGQGYGMLLGAACALEVQLFPVAASLWKRHFKLDSDKEKARKLALDRFPRLAQDLKSKKDAGRAEALLMALWWMERT